MEEKKSWIKGVILEGKYEGKPIEIQFGKPLKILCEGKDITKSLIALRIDLSARGHLIYLKLVEENYSQVPKEAWKNMVEEEYPSRHRSTLQGASTKLPRMRRKNS